MFWGITLETTKRYTQVVSDSFHVSMAALEPRVGKGNASQHISVMLEREKSEFLLCTLSQDKTIQQALDLNFIQGEEISFFLNGEGVVHLTGYLISDDVEPMSDEESDGEVEMKGAKRKASDYFLASSKKSKYDGDSDDEDLIREVDSDDSEEDDSYESDEDDSDESDEQMTPSPKKQKGGNAAQAKKGGQNSAVVVKPNQKQGNQQQQQAKPKNAGGNQQTPKQGQTPKMQPKVNGNQVAKEGQSAKKRRNRKKNKGDVSMNSSDAGTPVATTPQQPKKVQATPKQPNQTPKQNQQSPKQNQQSPKQDQQTPKQNQKTPKQNQQTPKQNQQTPKQNQQTPKPNQQTPKQNQQTPKPKPQKLQGGVVVEDLKVGEGKEAKQGSVVNLYYVGRFQKNNKVFDSVKKGETPFKFRLGRGEVIKGWDVGVQGMKLGGARRITIPAAQAYGSKGNEAIPPNSDLVFDVQLEQVS